MNDEMLLEQYDEMLDETNPQIVIGSLVYSPSDVLKSVDPIAYQVGFSDYLSFIEEE